MIYIHKSRHTFVYVFFEFEVLKKVVYKLVSSSAIRALWQAEQFQTFLQLFWECKLLQLSGTVWEEWSQGILLFLSVASSCRVLHQWDHGALWGQTGCCFQGLPPRTGRIFTEVTVSCCLFGCVFFTLKFSKGYSGMLLSRTTFLQLFWECALLLLGTAL